MKILCDECRKWEQYKIWNKAIKVIRSCKTIEQRQSAKIFVELAEPYLEGYMKYDLRLKLGDM